MIFFIFKFFNIQTMMDIVVSYNDIICTFSYVNELKMNTSIVTRDCPSLPICIFREGRYVNFSAFLGV